MILNRKDTDTDTDKIDNNKSLNDQREYLIKRLEEDIKYIDWLDENKPELDDWSKLIF